MTLTFAPPPFVSAPRPTRRFSRRASTPPSQDSTRVETDGVVLRPMRTGDTVRARDFLMAQYQAFNATDNTPIGHTHFRAFVSATALRTRLAGGSVAHVAEADGVILGVCELHLDGYLTLLYVRGDHQGRGLGRRLLALGLARLRIVAPEITVIRVRGTPYARGFYAHVGFEPLADALQEDHGIRFHPFVMRLTANARGAP